MTEVLTRSAAATYTEITLDEIEAYLKRAFRALRPRKDLKTGREVVYDLSLSPNVAVRVWTSVHEGAQQAAGVGADAIRVQLISVKRDRPLKPGKAPIVKRTQGWRDNLRERIEDAMEDYHDFEEALESGRYVDWSKKPG